MDCGGGAKDRGKPPLRKKDVGDTLRPLDCDTCCKCGKTGHWSRD